MDADAVDIPFDGCGIDGLAIVEGGALTQVEAPGVSSTVSQLWAACGTYPLPSAARQIKQS